MNGRHVFYATLVVASTLLGLLLLWQLGEVILVLVGAIIFASAIRPLVSWLVDRRIHVGSAILLVYLLVLGSVFSIFAISLPPLVEVGQGLLADRGIVARLALGLNELLTGLGYGTIGYDLIARASLEWNTLINGMGSVVKREGVSVLTSTAVVLGQFALGLVMAFYWLTSRDTIQGYLLSLTSVKHRGRVETIFNDVERTLGDYLRGTVILMLSIGVSAFVGLTILRVPNALPLALLAGLFEAVPMIGATVGAAPAVLIAFTVSPVKGLLTLLLFVIIQFAENNILVPRVMSKSVGLDPLLVIVAITAGSLLNGIVGALMAIPIVGAAQVMFRHLILDPMVEEASQRRMERGITVFDLDDDDDEPPKSSEIIIAQQ